jgi:hypothetical protein
MGIDAKGLVLMNKENGILTHELGSFNIHDGMEFVYKAYVEDGKVKLYLTTDNDVTDEEYNEVFDEYDAEQLEADGFQVEEVEDEFNPVWCYLFDYSDEFSDNEEAINFALDYHKNQIQSIFDKIRA